ncbi:hypothetical protein E2C01_072204 [Portunus trituberculatus]|uniref:Uncharacterized protein n=1 Tax=Portunus trituberculatus TaxID=210409 RepID=A0A5B7HZA1_PORTR|nr:hypothetical protein [Portunus trituberculatus]
MGWRDWRGSGATEEDGGKQQKEAELTGQQDGPPSPPPPPPRTGDLYSNLYNIKLRSYATSLV